MDLKWMTRGNLQFLDLVPIINKTKNQAFLQTTFMNCLIDAFWDENYKVIVKTQFIPSICYQFTMINFMAYTLNGEDDLGQM